MTARILSLGYRTKPRIEYEAMELLLRNLGPRTSREVIERAVFEIADRMRRLQQALADGDFDHVQAIAQRLSAISRQVGLAEFSDVATDLAWCIAQQDATATGAVAARLNRLADSSMFQAVQFADLTGA